MDRVESSRVKLVYVDEIPGDVKSLCVVDPIELFDKYDQDVIRGLEENSLNHKLNNDDLIYLNKGSHSDVTNVYFSNASKVSNAQLKLALAKYSKAQIVLFLTMEDEQSSSLSLSVIDTNLHEINIENQRSASSNKKERKPVAHLDAAELIKLIEEFENEVCKSEINLNLN